MKLYREDYSAVEADLAALRGMIVHRTTRDAFGSSMREDESTPPLLIVFMLSVLLLVLI